MAKISDLSAATQIADTDIVHIRTTGGIDNKVTGANLRNSVSAVSISPTTTQTISLSIYVAGLHVLANPSSSITLTFTNVLVQGRILIVVNNGSSNMSIVVEGVTYTLGVGDSFEFISDGSNMLFLRGPETPIGTVYIQFPGDSDPSTLKYPGTWSNVSSELAGDFIRFEGGQASTFESGQQSDAMQRITGTIGIFGNNGQMQGTGVFTPSGSGSVFISGNGVGTAAPSDVFDNSTSTSPNAAKTDDVETRAVNRTVRKWRRTA